MMNDEQRINRQFIIHHSSFIVALLAQLCRSGRQHYTISATLKMGARGHQKWEPLPMRSISIFGLILNVG
jgi:hypothetical protein